MTGSKLISSSEALAWRPHPRRASSCSLRGYAPALAIGAVITTAALGVGLGVGLRSSSSSSSSVAPAPTVCSVRVSASSSAGAPEVFVGAFSTLTAAFDALSARPPASRGGGATVALSGECAPPRSLRAADGGASAAAAVRVTGAAAAGAAPALISGGVAIPASWLAPVSDAAVAAQIQPAALPFVRQLDLAAHGLAAAAGALQCRPYMGGEASILPGNLVSAGMEAFAFGDPHNAGGDASPLTLARWPSRSRGPNEWAGGSVDGYRITVDAATATRLPAWAQQLREDPGSIYVHYLGGLRWDDAHHAVSAVSPQPPAASITLAACPSHYSDPGYDMLDNAGTFYAYNILAELDEPGEYFINRTSSMLYVWLPSATDAAYWDTAPWGAAVVPPLVSRAIDGARGAALRASAAAAASAPAMVLSVNETLLDLAGAAHMRFENVVLAFAQGAGIRLNGTTDIVFADALIENLGSMALNVSGGTQLQLRDSVVRHAGNGAVFLYAGDRATLSDSGHVLANTSLSYANRYMFCYVPMVALAGCGNAVRDCELYGGPHQGVFISGNEHSLQGSFLHDLVQAASDSGAVYTGRDFTYRGNVITDNTFHRINNIFSGDDVSAVYLDDQASGFSVTGNTFVNVSRALVLGGGRDTLFSGNHIDGTVNTAVHFDNRGMGWAASKCTPPNGEMIKFLARVPYNDSLWSARYPALAPILGDAPCVPRYNAILNNTYCRIAGATFIDSNSAKIASWNSSAYGNVEAC